MNYHHQIAGLSQVQRENFVDAVIVISTTEEIIVHCYTDLILDFERNAKKAVDIWLDNSLFCMTYDKETWTLLKEET